VAALEAPRLGLGEEKESKEDEENLEELVKLFLLKLMVYFFSKVFSK